jgi:hypothetical protein
MAIATMEQLAAVPVGQSVYVDDNRYVRFEDGWWSIDDTTDPVLRDRFFTGLVANGLVVTEGDRAFNVGATAVGDRYWYIVTGPPRDDGTVPCHRFCTLRGSNYHYADQAHVGVLQSRNYGVRQAWLREHLGPLPSEAWPLMVTALLEQVEVAKENAEKIEQRRADATRERDEALARVAQANRVREVLRAWVVGPEPTDPAPEATPRPDTLTWTTATNTTMSAF